MHSLDTAGDFAGDQRAGDQSHPPIEPEGRHGSHGHDDDGLSGGTGQAGNSSQHALHGRTAGKHMAGHQYQDHLHGECQQAPDSVAPERRHGARGLPLRDHAGPEDHQGQENRKEKGVGEPTLNNAAENFRQ